MAVEDGVLTAATSANWDSEVAQSNTLSMVLFWAEWCEPCAAMNETLRQLAKDYVGKVHFFTVNVDQEGGITSKYRVSIVPTIMCFRRGQKLHEMICSATREQLVAPIEVLTN